MMDKTFPAQKEYVRNLYVGQLRILGAPQRQQMCALLANAIDAGKLDFANEIRIIGYLDRRLAESTRTTHRNSQMQHKDRGQCI
jgi:hypothetical protein